jgi:superfamily II DNA or RNA helicase
MKKFTTYLGSRGYTLSRDELSKTQIERIKQDLTFRPFVPEGYGQQPEPYTVFRKTHKKIIVPKFYGLQEFGPPKENRLPRGDPIQCDFAGELRANQLAPVHKCLEKFEEQGGGILCLPCGYGKCLGRDTPVMMHDGSIKMVQDIKVGELLMGDDSTPRRVLSTCQGQEQLYRVVPKKGDPYVVNESHILSLKCSTNWSKKWQKGTVVDIPVKDYLALPKSHHGRGGPLLGYRVPVKFPEKKIGFDPYIIGLWLGDGSSRGTKISTQDAAVIKYLVQNLGQYDLYLKYCSQYDYAVRCCQKRTAMMQNPMMDELRKQNLIKNKHIPEDYKCNTRNVRLAILAGFLDADGHYVKGVYDVVQKNERLLDDIIYLARSLGFAAYKQKCTKSCMYKGEKKEGTYYRTTIHGPGLDELPILINRKKATPRKQIKDVLVSRIHLEKLDVGDYYGFEIDGNHRFLLGDFTVTHNTSIALYLASRLKVKTLVVVHKEFLVNQWKERTAQFLPTARVGMIQQKKVQVEKKDIVIGMLQSLSMRDYDQEIFNSFGLVIFDEVHCVPCRVFSKALQKIQTRYHLGLSATPNRADGMTRVTKLYVGPIIFRLDKRKAKKNPKGMQVITVKPKRLPLTSIYRERMNRWGRPDIPRMTSKLVTCTLRLGVQASLLLYLAVRDQRHILVLSDRIQHLKDLEAKIKNIYGRLFMQQYLAKKYFNHDITHLILSFAGSYHVTTPVKIGYYIGGMKQEERKKSEQCDIVLATYSMAKEAMDIPILDTLLMATPKSNIEQAVGRIMRKGEYPIERPPLVIDYVDPYSCFTYQAQKRRGFYERNHYPIQDLVFDERKLHLFEPDLQHCLENMMPVAIDPDAEELEEPDEDPEPTQAPPEVPTALLDNLGDSLFQ